MKTIKLSTLTVNERNPRTIDKKAFKRLCDSIERDPQFMELRPIVTDEEGVILGGNQRYRACQFLGKTSVPASWVVKAEGLTEAQRKRFIVVDNAPEGMAGEWDQDILAEDYDMQELEEMGFDKLLDSLYEEDLSNEAVEYTEQYSVLIVCKDETEQLELIRKMQKEGRECRALIS